MGIEELINYVNQYVTIPLYANDFPKKAKGDCGFVRLEGGGAPHMYIDGLTYPSMQVMIRHEDEQAASIEAQQVWDTFNNKSNFMIGATRVRFASNGQSVPIYVGKDESGRTLYSVNVSLIIL